METCNLKWYSLADGRILSFQKVGAGRTQCVSVGCPSVPLPLLINGSVQPLITAAAGLRSRLCV